MSIINANPALAQILAKSLPELMAFEHMSEADIRSRIDQGSLALLGNPKHAKVRPTLIGQPARVKVNANIGTSPITSDMGTETDKLQVAETAGADAVMDLSTAGDLDGIRERMLAATYLPLGTVPLYAVAQQCTESGRDPAGFEPAELLAEVAKQAEQGVDFMTLHCGLTKRGAELAQSGSRKLGIVSRGGAILARWMRRTGEENPLLTHYDELLEICRRHNVVISLGDGLRPGAGIDAGDPAQWEEVLTLGILAKRAWAAGVQVMIEGPGHVPLHLVQAQIQGIKRATFGAPLYVLGPLVTDTAAGRDHIAGAIGGAMAAQFGADFLCYLTPAEHLCLPDAKDVHEGVLASRIAAQAGETALGRPWAVAREEAMCEARLRLDWAGMADAALDPCLVRQRSQGTEHGKECGMCGKFCAIRMAEPEK
ncbi:MAG: phosphomethylpyrimidine synthase ThiC [Humidesulfovibrio sp.]|uniref:phosphomethylpyrimidine synthase ThiC n=1 Tax=Humidesulfovibrio sp. TaxID=2910988 RepID=UPI0027368C5D|nr:phosphomethylpyrimidine synthase ThiC [Humidesulfovibrio sp.]MDP2848113.1 phosphomethylpyrimidine synthase ThiC [Humidesulfovibrio sp.]